ncbi:MAG: OmpA family protein [Chitinophagaceae bacterium]|nr:MAG: OmpA family protein [Chitinophagaceae bacterium]
MRNRLLLLVLLLPALANSQSLMDRLKNKVKSRAEQKVDQGMDKGLDKAEEGAAGAVKKNKASSGEEAEATPDAEPAASTAATPAVSKGAVATPAAFKSYTRYDFVPGEEIVYAEDFAQDAIGEFPLKWGTNNRGEVVTIEGMEGKWLRMFKDSRFVSPPIKSLPGNFMVEFDLVLHIPPNTLSSNFPYLEMHLLHTDPADDRGRKLLLQRHMQVKSDMELHLNPYPDESSTLSLVTTEGYNDTYFSKEGKGIPSIGKYIDKRIHVAMWVQQERLRLWINGEKIYDLPQAMPTKLPWNRLEFQTGGSPYDEEATGYYISNFRLSHAAPDMRSKLITEGKFVTSGICFDVASDKIRPESAGVLQELAKVLQENPAVKVRITGHTDNDGDAAKNLALSKARAASVRDALAALGVDAARLQTDGKGAAQPVADNSSKEGKAKNRRVEFVKL